jgi:23S rRNA pseudouridine1911/1915/1917 synthase
MEFLRNRGFSRNILASMKPYKDAIQLNGTRAFATTVLKDGDFLRIRVPETETSDQIIPVEMPLNILYEDEDILVVNKPADMPIHPSIGNYENTLANGIAHYYARQGKPFVYRCINRLDRDTTGGLILAKNPYSGAVLSQQMRNRQIRRTYLAVVEGITEKEGTIDAPIARADDSLILRKVDYETGERAVTHYQCLDVKDGYSLVELHLETGRTHQIRVHMNHIGHPLPGDFLYHPVYDRIHRQALHSYQLEFLHPVTDEPLLFTAPVPQDFCLAFDPHLKLF